MARLAGRNKATRSLEKSPSVGCGAPVVRRIAAPAAIAAIMGLSGCTSGPLPPVFGAVFGLENAERTPHRSGEIPAAVVAPGDRVLGLSANSPGQCIYQRARSNRRFVADCPEGYDV
ncbi:hypothetical protein [Jiella sonneratiae]|uniref:Uncharacterized protein n=1 Tax=Jiella sonneratiae TaxID=2816856 RepID=A0ABS3J5A8_9HYPH|nr:hypothetical protein [Jiella sonneratiae]MBO0904865.1 hypothetical protein [Jiella sonneratiae]